ncbi:hypothetical protein Tco_1099324 [Tanacetum coccineum]
MCTGPLGGYGYGRPIWNRACPDDRSINSTMGGDDGVSGVSTLTGRGHHSDDKNGEVAGNGGLWVLLMDPRMDQI